MNIQFTPKLFIIVCAACSLFSCDAINTEFVNNSVNPMNKFPRLEQLDIAAPSANKIPSHRNFHGNTLNDDYFWLKDQGYPEVNDQAVLDYLREENAYFDKFIEPHSSFVQTIFEEFKGRTDETEESVPFIDNGYEYRWYFRQGEEYRTRSRKNLATGEETIFLDETKLAQGHMYFVLGDWEFSHDNRYLAYTVDTAGDERYELRILDTHTDQYLTDVLRNVQGQFSFSKKGNAIVYALIEEERWHSKEIKVHIIGQSQSEDKTLYREDDDGFYIGFGLTSSKEYLIVVSQQGSVTESYAINSDLSGDLIKLVSREQAFTHDIDHAHGYFYVLANDTHSNFRIARVSDQQPEYQHWQTLQTGSDDSYLLNIKTFDDFFVLKSRNLGLDKLELIDYPDSNQTELSNSLVRHSIEFPESVITVNIGVNPEFNSEILRLNYESMITPATVFDYQLDSNELITRKVQKVPSGYDPSQYHSERLMIPARDGVDIPVTLVYKNGFQRDGSQPMWLYGYGAYAHTVTPSFSTMRLSALDRGFSYAIAHVRGGSMLSYQWYLDGKLRKRTNTFNDFVDVARGLIDKQYVQAGNISISGRSAGGELMGAAVIQVPDLWRSVNLGVPFVDVLNTMLDASLPLTPPEWKEWGNPIESAEDYAFIESYSPYDQIQSRDYPPMFVSGGLNDPRVTYWEPAKWTAKMRATKTDKNLLVMRINMGAGHFANSGRYGRLLDYAEEYAFLFLAHNIDK